MQPTVSSTPPAPPQPVPTPPDAEQPQPRSESAQEPVGVEFAGLPRIRRFTEFELDPVEDESTYTGRRRRVENENGGAGRQPEELPAGRRHSRAEEDGEGQLARTFDREGGGSR
jgi:hypothetical protein